MQYILGGIFVNYLRAVNVAKQILAVISRVPNSGREKMANDKSIKLNI